jgi:streptogramin lyase
MNLLLLRGTPSQRRARVRQRRSGGRVRAAVLMIVALCAGCLVSAVGPAAAQASRSASPPALAALVGSQSAPRPAPGAHADPDSDSVGGARPLCLVGYCVTSAKPRGNGARQTSAAAALGGTGPSAVQPRAAAASALGVPLCIPGYCITSVNQMGDGAIYCSGQLTEVLQVSVIVGPNVGYAFPYVTVEAQNIDDPSEFASGFASLSDAGQGPAGLQFVVRMVIPGPGTYNGFASGEGAGLPPSLATNFPFTFGVSFWSPISVVKGDPECQPDDPSIAERVETALKGAILMGPTTNELAGLLGLGAETFKENLELLDAIEGEVGLFMVEWALTDPPDPNYMQTVQYSPAIIPPVAPGLNASQQAALSTVFNTYSIAIGYLRAFLTSFERAWGAENANSAFWYDTQMNAAAGFATQAANVFQLLPGQLGAVQHAFAPEPVGVPITADELTAFQNAVLAGNVDATQLADLESLGLSASDAQSVIEGAAAADASQYIGDDLSVIFSAGDNNYLTMANELNSFAAFASTAVQAPPPSITGVTPSSGSSLGGTSVTVTGTNLANVAVIQFGPSNPGSLALSCTDTSCTVTAPPGSIGTVDVTAISAGGPSAATAADEFTYQPPPPPTVTQLSPSSGYVTGGTPITVTGTNLGLATEIDFGSGDPGTDLTCSDTSCTVIAPTGTAGTVDVTVVTPGGTSAVSTADQFTYLALPPAPTVTGVSPSTGSVSGGTTVTVSGTSMSSATEIEFGSGNPGTDLSCTATSCTVVSPPGSVGSVDVLVTDPGGTSAATTADTFSYLIPPPPVVNQVSPASGVILGGTAVTITGTDLAGASEIDFGPDNAATINSCTATSCSVTSPSGNAGVVDVTVTTAGGTSADVAADEYTFTLPAAPTVTQVSPSNGPQSGGTLVTVTGTSLTDSTEIYFGTAGSGSDVTCADTSCTVQAPPGAVGTVDITVVGPGGQTSATTSADQFTYLPLDITELPLPSGITSVPGHLTAGIGGRVWFTEPDPSYYGTVDPTGAITETATATADSFPVGITEGPDGRMWYAEQVPNELAAVDASGTQTEYPIPTTAEDDVLGVTAGPDSRIWFTLFESGQIGAMTTDGTVTLYPLANSNAEPRNIAVGPDGRLWFTEYGANQIGAITTGGLITEYPMPSGSNPWDITAGPDGRMWFTESGSPDAIGAITTSGVITSYSVPDPDAGLSGITTGADGRLWFPEANDNEIGAITTNGAVSEYATPMADQPGYITAGPNIGGQPSLTYTEDGGPYLGEITNLPTAGQTEPAAITSPASATFTVGVQGSFTVTTTGTPAPAVSETGPLPAGVTFSSATGTVSGTPAAGTSGTYPVTLTAHNGVGPDATQAFTLTVNQQAAITSAAGTTFTAGTAGSFQVAVTGFPAPAVSETGPLPAGVTFIAATGIIAGTPQAGTGGTYPVTLTAHNGVGPDAIQAFTLTVKAVTRAPAITSASSARATAGKPFAFTVTSTGEPVPTLIVSGMLPSHITFAAHANGTATLAGTLPASARGIYRLTFAAANTAGTATQSFTLTVVIAPRHHHRDGGSRRDPRTYGGQRGRLVSR